MRQASARARRERGRHGPGATPTRWTWPARRPHHAPPGHRRARRPDVDIAVSSRIAATFLANAPARLDALDARLARAAAPADVAWTLCGFAGKELDLVDAIAYLRDPCGATLTQQAAWGPKRAASRVLESRLTLAVGQGIVGRCARLRLPQRTGDARFDPRYVPDDQANLSELAVPIQCGRALYGVLDSEHPDADFYTLAHEHALQAIAERGARRLEALAAPARR